MSHLGTAVNVLTNTSSKSMVICRIQIKLIPILFVGPNVLTESCLGSGEGGGGIGLQSSSFCRWFWCCFCGCICGGISSDPVSDFSFSIGLGFFLCLTGRPFLRLAVWHDPAPEGYKHVPPIIQHLFQHRAERVVGGICA